MKLIDLEESDLNDVIKKDSVIVEFGTFDSLDSIHEIDERLSNLIPETLGKHDMHEVAIDDSHGRFIAYGRNAEKLFKIMLPVLKEYEFLQNASVYLNFVDGNEERDLEFKLSSIELLT